LERELRGRFGTRILAEVIPHDDCIEEALGTGRIGSHLYPDSPAARQYHQLVSKLNLADAASPGIESPELVQTLREAVGLASLPTVPAAASVPAPSADPPQPATGPSLEVPPFTSLPETVKPAMPNHRSRRLTRSGESMRPRPGAGSTTPAPMRRKGFPAKSQQADEEIAASAFVPCPSPHHTSQALAQLWPLWILLGAVLGGGLRLVPPSPSLLPIFLGLGAALLVVVLFLMARQKRLAFSSALGKSRVWLRKKITKKPAPRQDERQEYLSARLASLANSSKSARRAADSN
jgi:hypothetical protein